MDVKAAVRLAKQYLGELFADEEITNIGLEEVRFDELSSAWSVTIGFSRPWDQPNNAASALAGNVLYPKRSYKVVLISDDNAGIISVSNREFGS